MNQKLTLAMASFGDEKNVQEKVQKQKAQEQKAKKMKIEKDW